MTVTLLCPNLKCRTVLQVPEMVRGKHVRCSHCGATLLVPAAKSSKTENAAKADDAADKKPAATK